MVSREYLDQGRLTAPVCTKEGMDMPSPEREVYASQCLDASEALFQCPDYETRGLGLIRGQLAPHSCRYFFRNS